MHSALLARAGAIYAVGCELGAHGDDDCYGIDDN